MARVYDNWERLVAATLSREELRLSGQRTPSDISSASLSSSSSSFSFTASSGQVSSFKFQTASSGQVSSFKFPIFLSGNSFTYYQILQATSYLSKSNLIKNGHSGDLFYGVLEDGVEVVVKKTDISSVKKERDFVSEVEIFGKVSHSRLVPFLGHCLENIKEKFLVYKYMPNKDLSTSFYKKKVSEYNFDLISLDWITRLKIAIGAAEGLSYLHNECIPPLVHRDVQASSILLDDKFTVRLGSLSEVCTVEIKEGNENKIANQNWIARFLRLPKGTSPSQKGTSDTSNAMFKDDVYCFGKVLLELVTGYLGISADTMEDWMEKTLPCISTNDMEQVVNIVDPSLVIDEDLLMEVWAVAIVAKACLSPNPLTRPTMDHVLKALENPLKVVTAEEAESATFTVY